MFDRKDALKLWESEIGKKEYAYDFAGRKIKRTDYNIDNQVGWVVGYVKPVSCGGPTNIGNIIIMHYRTNEEKADNYPRFKVIGDEYEALYDERSDSYYIEKVYNDDDDEGIFI